VFECPEAPVADPLKPRSNQAPDEAPDEARGLRVVLLTNFIPPYRLPLYEALARRVASLTVLVSTPVEGNRGWRPSAGDLDVRVQRTLSVRRAWRHPSGFADTTYVHVPIDTLAQLRALRPDVIVSAELGFRSLFSALYCFRRRTGLVLWATLSERTERGRGRMRHVLRRWLLRRADRVVVNGASGERYVARFGVTRDRIDHIPYVALPGFRHAEDGTVPATALRNLLFVGQLTERKGLIPFLNALDAWSRANPDREIAFTIAGGGPQAHALQRVQLHDSITLDMVGEQDPGALPALFARADAFVFPTLADEWGVVVNEALAAGLPVLGSVHSQAIEELCEEGTTGWIFDPEDERSTVAAIDRAFSTTEEQLRRMSLSGRDRSQHLTPEWAADRLLQTILAAASR
jgi:glycosyltransferase involved in cell wall biosynthesis